MASKEVITKIVLNDKRKTKMKVKEILGEGRFLLIDGSIVEGKEISQIIRETI